MGSPRSPAKQAALFWAKVDKRPRPTGCWLYTGFTKWDGYGWLARSLNGKTRYMTAHRYAWILTHGMPPEGAHILHGCNVAACCNPAHLRLGTHQENMADKILAGRHIHGEAMHTAKLTEPQVLEMRQLRRDGWKLRVLAERFGVFPSSVSGICNRVTWKHLP